MPRQPQDNKQHGFVFTVNNPTVDDMSDIERLKDQCSYITYGTEIGESGTPHWQGFVWYTDRVRSTAVRRVLRRAFVEVARGTPEQAITYCHKDGVVFEHGDRPKQRLGERERWAWIVEQAEKGELEPIKCEYPGLYVRYYERLRGLCRRTGAILDGALEHEWWVGPTGTGKSKRAWEQYPDHFQKELNKWWCGYSNEEVVVIEEWSPKNECTASALKIWADRYPFTGQVKGGNLMKIRPKKIIVTSNYTIDQCFPNKEDAEPIKRRFKTVHFREFFNMADDPEVKAWLTNLECTENMLSLEEIDLD